MLYKNLDNSIILSKNNGVITVIKGGNIWENGYKFNHTTDLPYYWKPLSFKMYLNLIK